MKNKRLIALAVGLIVISGCSYYLYAVKYCATRANLVVSLSDNLRGVLKTTADQDYKLSFKRCMGTYGLER